MKFDILRMIYAVEDVEKTADFYSDAFGFKQLLADGYTSSQWIELQTDSCNIGVYKGNPIDNKGEIRVVFYVKDMSAAVEYMKDKGAVLEEIEGRDQYQVCNGSDPEQAILFQLSNRKQEEGSVAR